MSSLGSLISLDAAPAARRRLLGHCLSCVWQETGTVSLRLSGTEEVELELAAGDRIKLAIGERCCVGYRPPPRWELLPCPDAASPARGSQCEQCLERSALLACLRCTGERCMSVARRADCISPENHGVYIASFASGIVKVGVARRERITERIGEQGARVAIVLAYADGREARWIENQIARVGVSDRLSPSEHLAAWTSQANPDELSGELARLAGELRLRLPTVRWADELAMLTLPAIEPFPHRPRYLQRPEGRVLRGEILRVAGRTLLLETAGDELLALDAGSLVGCLLTQPGIGEHSQEQLAIRL